MVDNAVHELNLAWSEGNSTKRNACICNFLAWHYIAQAVKACSHVQTLTLCIYKVIQMRSLIISGLLFFWGQDNFIVISYVCIYIYIFVCVCVYIYCITHIYFYISRMLSKATFLFSNFEFSVWIYYIYSCDSKNSEFSVTWSFRKHSNMLLILFVYKLWYIPPPRILWRIHILKEQHFLK